MWKNTASRPSWSRLGRILSRFVTDLGVIFIDFSLVVKAFREHRRFSKNITSRAVLDRTWADLGRFWSPKCAPNGTQNDSQNHQNSNQKKDEKKSEKRHQHRPKKPEPAVNGKRRLNTLFVIKTHSACISTFYFLKRYVFWTDVQNLVKILKPSKQHHMFCYSWPSRGPLGASWAPLGGLLGASWGLLEPLGGLWEPLGSLLGTSWSLLGPSWSLS